MPFGIRQELNLLQFVLETNALPIELRSTTYLCTAV